MGGSVDMYEISGRRTWQVNLKHQTRSYDSTDDDILCHFCPSRSCPRSAFPAWFLPSLFQVRRTSLAWSPDPQRSQDLVAFRGWSFLHRLHRAPWNPWGGSGAWRVDSAWRVLARVPGSCERTGFVRMHPSANAPSSDLK